MLAVRSRACDGRAGELHACPYLPTARMQVNNVYIFPGLSFGAVSCHARTLPDEVFLAAAEAVARSLNDKDISEDRVVPHPDRIREVGLNVATAVALECRRLGLADKLLGWSEVEVHATLQTMMWAPARPSAKL